MDSYLSIKVLVVSALLAGCSAQSETKQKEADPVLPVMQLTRQDATLDRDYASNLEAIQNVEVRARVAGYLDKILIDEGKTVRKGQLLFQLNPAEYQVKVAEARASLESAVAQAQ